MAPGLPGVFELLRHGRPVTLIDIDEDQLTRGRSTSPVTSNRQSFGSTSGIP